MLKAAFLCSLLLCTYGSDRAQESAPNPQCLQPSIMSRRIIDVNASRAAGAAFLSNIRRPPSRTCADVCCAEPGCNLAVFRPDDESAIAPSEKDGGSSCYLFNCRSPSVCTLAEHSHYSIALVVRAHPPAAVATTPASSRKVAFLGSCQLGDQCEGINTECSAGMCMCKENYHHKNDVCRERCDPVTSYECINGGVEYSGPDCIALYNVCNGIPECADGSDEFDCAAGRVTPTVTAADGSAAVRTSVAVVPQLAVASGKLQQQHVASAADASSMMRSHSARAPSAAAGQQQLQSQRQSASGAAAGGGSAAFAAADEESELDEALSPIPHSARRPAQSSIPRSGRRPPAAVGLPSVGLRSRPLAGYYLPPAGQPGEYTDDAYDYDGGGGGGDYRRVLLGSLVPEEAGLVDGERPLVSDFAGDRRPTLLRRPGQQQQQPPLFRKLAADVYTPYRELLPAVNPLTGDRAEDDEHEAPRQYANVDAPHGRTWGSKSRARLPPAAGAAANQEGLYRPQLADPNEEWLIDHSRKTGNLGSAGPDMSQNDLSKGLLQQSTFNVHVSSTPPDPTGAALPVTGGAISHGAAATQSSAASKQPDAPSVVAVRPPAAMQPSSVAVVASKDQQQQPQPGPTGAAREPPRASTPRGDSGSRDGDVPAAAGVNGGHAVPAAAGQLDTSWAAAQRGSAVAALVLGTLLAVILVAYGVRRCIVGASPGNLVHRVKAMGWGSKPDADYLINGMYL